MSDRLTPNQVRKRTIDIRISGDPELAAAYCELLVNTSEKIGKEAVKWKGPYDAKNEPGIVNYFLELVPGGTNGKIGTD